MTGRNLKLTTPQDVLTARDSLEYWAQKHMAVARGNAVVLTNDGKRVAADTLVAYTTDAARPASAGPQAVKASAEPDAKADDPLAASGQAAKGGRDRQRLGPHSDGNRDWRSGRLCA